MRPNLLFSSNHVTALAALTIVQIFITQSAIASEEHDWHRHHIEVPFGAAFKSDKVLAFVGLEYEYRYNDRIGFGGYYEEVFGKTDLQAFGLLFTYHPDNHWKLFGGPAVERKLGTDENKFLFKLAVAYDFHAGNWSFGPMAAIDFVEDNHQIGYLGWSVGYGF